MSFTLFKIGGSRKNTLNNIATFQCFPYFLKNTAYHYTSLRRNHSIIYPLQLLAIRGTEIQSPLHADCQRRKETLNSVAGANISKDRKH